ncbi:MAG: hypothetical protein LAO31_13015 [Acidobacteriia bacterium]|nr:hypothetical protein [Terriglobia bacterium]
MATETKRELLDRIEGLETENEVLQSQIDEISDIIGDSGEEEQGSEDDDQGEE